MHAILLLAAIAAAGQWGYGSVVVREDPKRDEKLRKEEIEAELKIWRNAAQSFVERHKIQPSDTGLVLLDMRENARKMLKAKQLSSSFAALPPGGVVTVAAVAEGSQAEKAGLKLGDVIVEVDGRKIGSASLCRKALVDSSGPVKVELSRPEEKAGKLRWRSVTVSLSRP